MGEICPFRAPYDIPSGISPDAFLCDPEIHSSNKDDFGHLGLELSYLENWSDSGTLDTLLQPLAAVASGNCRYDNYQNTTSTTALQDLGSYRSLLRTYPLDSDQHPYN